MGPHDLRRHLLVRRRVIFLDYQPQNDHLSRLAGKCLLFIVLTLAECGGLIFSGGEKDGSTVSSDQHSRELEKKCLLLEQQVHEMEVSTIPGHPSLTHSNTYSS